MNQQGFRPQQGQWGGTGGAGYGSGQFGQEAGGGYGRGQQEMFSGGSSSYGGQYGGQQGGYGGGGPQAWGQGGQRDVAFNPQTMNKDYDLVSVLYHALQAADTCARYGQDARREGSHEVASFMEQVQQQNQQIAQRAKELLFRQRQV